MLDLKKDQVKKIARGIQEAVVAEMEKEPRDDPLAKEVFKKMKEGLDDFDKDSEKQWERMEKRKGDKIEDMESEFKDAIDEAKEDGLTGRRPNWIG